MIAKLGRSKHFAIATTIVIAIIGSAEISDAFMVLVIGTIFALIGIKRRDVPTQIS